MPAFAAPRPVSLGTRRQQWAPLSCPAQCETTPRSPFPCMALQNTPETDSGPSTTQAEPSPPTASPPHRLSRRDLLRLLSGSAALASLTLTLGSRAQWRYLSPKGILNTMFGDRMSLPASAASAASASFSSALNLIGDRDRGADFPCPEFPKDADWINSGRLSLRRELSDKVVLLDFFTYCCINCMHLLPQLSALEAKYGGDGSRGFAVVGVHSAKFSAERETANIGAAVARLGISHPVLNDERMAVWSALGVTSWPTLVLLGPRSNVLAVWTGEGHAADVNNMVSAALQFYDKELNRTPLPTAPALSARDRGGAGTALRYPGKVATAGDGKMLYVADSANHRVLEVDIASGGVARAFGDGAAGLTDGTEPRFRSPQGVAVSGATLFVADTENHAVRAVDLSSGFVTTLGGTGVQGFDYSGGSVGAEQKLSSPWDVEVADGRLYVAMAGTHQLWSLALGKHDAIWEVFSGTGREQEKNSTAARAAAWAQPSHLSFGAGMLYVADSESSSVRAVDLTSGMNPTRTLAGGDGVLPENLFAFGDRDGRGSAARFQHPLAVVYDPTRDLVFVADSYNHRIKTVNRSGVARAFCGAGKPGFSDGVGKKAEFWEPSGLALSADGNALYVADTNNSAVRVVDIASKAVTTLEISEGEDTGVKKEQGPLIPNRRRATVSVEGQNVGQKSVLSFVISLPEGTHFTPGTTSRFQGSAVVPTVGEPAYAIIESGAVAANEETRSGSFNIDLSKASTLPKRGDGLVEVESVFYYCGDTDGVCRTDSQVFQFSVDEAAASRNVSVSRTIVPRRSRSVASQ